VLLCVIAASTDENCGNERKTFMKGKYLIFLMYISTEGKKSKSKNKN
jgi:hypothetical protein